MENKQIDKINPRVMEYPGIRDMLVFSRIFRILLGKYAGSFDANFNFVLDKQVKISLKNLANKAVQLPYKNAEMPTRFYNLIGYISIDADPILRAELKNELGEKTPLVDFILIGFDLSNNAIVIQPCEVKFSSDGLKPAHVNRLIQVGHANQILATISMEKIIQDTILRITQELKLNVAPKILVTHGKYMLPRYVRNLQYVDIKNLQPDYYGIFPISLVNMQDSILRKARPMLENHQIIFFPFNDRNYISTEFIDFIKENLPEFNIDGLTNTFRLMMVQKGRLQNWGINSTDQACVISVPYENAMIIRLLEIGLRNRFDNDFSRISTFFNQYHIDTIEKLIQELARLENINAV